MEEQSNNGMRNHLSNHLWDKEKVVIIYPHSIPSLILTDNHVGKSLIDRDVMFPPFLLPDCILWVVGYLVVEGWPKDLLAIAIIMAFKIGVRNEDRNRSFLGSEKLLDIRFLSIRQRIRRLRSVVSQNHSSTMPSVPIHI